MTPHRKVMFVVTSLMGAGHLQRTMVIARAVVAAGGDALVVSGGRPPGFLHLGGVDVLHLPPVWSDGINYARMHSPEGEADDHYFAKRAHRLLEAFEEFQPDILVTELFPFGRRALSDEFAILLDHAQKHAHIYASVRDVLEPKKKAKRHTEIADRLRRWYSGVLVHGDPEVIDLGATWPFAHEWSEQLFYSGYVSEPSPEPIATDEILVAVGGGVIGRNLLALAIRAAEGSNRTWRLRVGGATASADILELEQQVGSASVLIEPASPDYRARLAGCVCSVSLFGYNTATDLLIANSPAVIAPMTEGGEREQQIRAAAFADKLGFALLQDRSPAALLEAVETATSVAQVSRPKVNIDGAANTAAYLLTR